MSTGSVTGSSAVGTLTRKQVRQQPPSNETKPHLQSILNNNVSTNVTRTMDLTCVSRAGPNYLSTDFWTPAFASQDAGRVMNPSHTVFARDPSVPPWVLRQQQSRSPLRMFRGNGVRSSHRGVHVDGFVTASVPGEIGPHKHEPEVAPAFDDADQQQDGTCNCFPDTSYCLPSGEGVHVYAPTTFEYDGAGRATRFAPTYSVMDGLHVSRCDDAWWSRAARINVTNSLFAHNWVGMTNHGPGGNFCPGSGSQANPGQGNSNLYIRIHI